MGGVPKVIFAGYSTDPLNYGYLHDLVKIALEAGQVVGFHTKAIKINDELLQLLTESSLADKSYFSVSIDAGSNTVYNKVHGITNSNAAIYSQVVDNIKRLADRRNKYGTKFDLSATYLVNHLNCNRQEILKAIDDLRSSGVDLIRFTFPQMPREGVPALLSDYVPSRDAVEGIMQDIEPVIQSENSAECQLIIRDMDKEFDAINLKRSLPCFSRFIFPSIGFDGWLYHCSESASLDFRELSLGNLATQNFWDCYFNYDIKNFEREIARSCQKMEQANCKCDRKEHGVNSALRCHIDIPHEYFPHTTNE